MQDFLLNIYPWLKALHIIAVISWMAAMLYLPRLYVYHAQAEKKSPQSEAFKVMERKLLRLILNPAMIAAWLFGGLMIWANPALFSQGWFHAKFTCLVLMQIVHALYARWRRTFDRDENTKDHVFYRWWNEAPTLLMVVIVVLAVVKPF